MCVQISFSSDDITRIIKMPFWTLCVSPLRHVLQNNRRSLPLVADQLQGLGWEQRWGLRTDSSRCCSSQGVASLLASQSLSLPILKMG